MKKRTQSPPWLKLAQQLLDGMADEHRSSHSNAKTFNITVSCVKTLLGGFALSDKQAAAFLENIRCRIPNHSTFTWNEPIKLTKRQMQFKSNYPDLITFMDGVDDMYDDICKAFATKMMEMRDNGWTLEQQREWTDQMVENISALNVSAQVAGEK